MREHAFLKRLRDSQTSLTDIAKEALGNHLIAQDLIRAIETDSQPKCSMHDGRWTIEMIMAAYESQRLNKPVGLPLVERRHPPALL